MTKPALGEIPPVTPEHGIANRLCSSSASASISSFRRQAAVSLVPLA